MNILLKYVRYSARKVLETYHCNVSDEQVSRYPGLSELVERSYGSIANLTDEQIDTCSLKDSAMGFLLIVPVSWVIRFYYGLFNLFHLGKG